MTKEAEQNFKKILERFLQDMHDKNYEAMLDYIGTERRPDLLDFLKEAFEEQLDEYEYDYVDPYGVECDDPEIEQLEVYELTDDSGFVIDYYLTSDGEPIGFVLQLNFVYTDAEKKEVKCSFRDIDYA